MLLVCQPSPKYMGHMLNAKIVRAVGPTLSSDGTRSGLSAVAAQTVRACVESVRFQDFL
jgi:hypothetical protein